MSGTGGNDPPIVIRRVKKVMGGGHHGGAWKVAYADFVTAMMAFFMLLWLISNPDKDKLKGLAQYFTPGPPSAPQASGNSSGQSNTPGSGGTTNRDKADGAKKQGQPTIQAQQAGVTRGGSAVVPSAALKVLAQELKLSLDTVAADPSDAAALSTEADGETMRLSIADNARQSMFRGSSAQLNGWGEMMLARVAARLKSADIRIAVEGHTDGAGGGSDANWRLSGERALSARNALIRNGLSADRFTQVIAMANTRPVYPDQPLRPENRRITLVLVAEQSALPSDASFKF